MSHIFISYSRKNQVYARTLADDLLRRGFDVWIDDRIDYGDNWEREIFKAIDACVAFIVIMTPDSYASDWVLRECQYAERRKKPPFPLLLDHEEFPRYISTQYVDVRKGALPPADFFARLARVIAPKAAQGADVTNPSPPNPSPTQAGRGEKVDSPETPPPTPPRIRGGEKTDAPPVGTRHASSAAIPPVTSAAPRDTRQFPIITKPEWVGQGKLLPEPFEWCVVPKGKVTLEAGGYLKTDTTFDVGEFQMARYPITNAQFEVFVTAKDGWHDSQWWDYSDEAKAWRTENKQSAAARFKNCADCPRETVTWYAAVAFTRWLSAKTGTAVTLPTEQQWQRAAQGDDGRAYPWGNEWNERKYNTTARRIATTTPVTHYPQGASPYGLLDMSGNVWEWCLTVYRTGINELNGTNVRRVLRGGSWFNSSDVARVTNCKSFYAPNDSYDSVGFRLVAWFPST